MDIAEFTRLWHDVVAKQNHYNSVKSDEREAVRMLNRAKIAVSAFLDRELEKECGPKATLQFDADDKSMIQEVVDMLREREKRGIKDPIVQTPLPPLSTKPVGGA